MIASPAPSSQRPLLKVSDIAKSFGGLNVLRNISLAVPERGIVGLLGPNGSGKTTLFNIISGFLPPNTGTMKLDGVEIGALSVAARSRAGIVRTFQTPKVFESLTVIENVTLGFHKATHGGYIAGMVAWPSARESLAAAHDKAESLLARLSLSRLAETSARLLTAGQRRNLEVARALAAAPRILMLDEPSTGLTREETFALANLLVRLRDEGMTIFIVSHDMEFLHIVDEAHVLYFGEIIATADLPTLQADPKVRQIYLGA